MVSHRIHRNEVNVSYVRRLGAWLLLVVALHCFASAQTGIDPGFDAEPVEIPTVGNTAPRPVTSMDLLTLRDIRGLQISPDGKYVAFMLIQAVYETNHYRSGMFAIGTERGSKPVSLGTAGPGRWDEANEWLPENPVWSLDSRYIYRPMKSNGAWQVWRWDREGGAPIQVTHSQHDVQTVSLSPDGGRLILTLEAPSGVDRKKLSEQGILYDGRFDATGQSIIDRLATIPGAESETWIYDLASGSSHEATIDEQRELTVSADASVVPNVELSSQIFTKKEIEEEKIYSYNVSPDRKRVAYWRIADDASRSQFRTYPLLVRLISGGVPVTLATWPYYPGEYWWSPDSKQIYFTEDNGNNPDDPRTTRIMAAAAAGGEVRPVLDSSDVFSQYSSDKSRRLLACIREKSITPPEVALADLSTGEVRTLVDVNPELQNVQMSPAKRIDVLDRRGQRFWGHLVLPLGYEPGKRYPLIITTYVDSAGFLRGGVGDEYPIQVFAANGFAVFNFNAIGRDRNATSGNFDNTLLQWQAPTEALEAAIAKLADEGIVDRSKVGITGLSFGAVMVHYGISHSGLFRTAVASGPAWDPILFYIARDSLRDAWASELNLGPPHGGSATNWQKMSAALNAGSVNTPLLINAADSEYTYCMELVTILRTLKKPVEMFIYPDERHEKNQPKHRYSIYERNIDWFNFWLKGEEDPDPAKAEQYARWRELRKLQEQNQKKSTNATSRTSN
jgi:dipeptidyl aminopeptidase/acylaminoacyl peptidase